MESRGKPVDVAEFDEAPAAIGEHFLEPLERDLRRLATQSLGVALFGPHFCDFARFDDVVNGVEPIARLGRDI